MKPDLLPFPPIFQGFPLTVKLRGCTQVILWSNNLRHNTQVDPNHHGNLRVPPLCRGGGIGGVPLDSHDNHWSKNLRHYPSSANPRPPNFLFSTFCQPKPATNYPVRHFWFWMVGFSRWFWVLNGFSRWLVEIKRQGEWFSRRSWQDSRFFFSAYVCVS